VPRVVLVLPTSTYRAGDFVEAASALGIDVVVAADEVTPLLGDRAVALPLDGSTAADAVEQLDQRLPVDAVVGVDDASVVAAAVAAERLGLPHNPPDAVRLTRDKAGLRARLDVAEVPQPAWRTAGPDDDAGDVAAAVGFPAVLKPTGLSASTGVIRADDAEQARAAAARIRRILADQEREPDAPILVESFVAGPEVAVEAILRDGVLEPLAVFDKPDAPDGPYFEETIYVTPSRHPADVQDELLRVVTAACEALGLTEGPVHAEARLGPEGVRLLEVAARSIGGLCARALRFGAGVSLEEVILRHAVGMGLDGLGREPGASGVMMLPIRERGSLVEVRGQDEARAVAGVVGLEITIPRGRTLVPLPEGDRYLGFLFARGAEPDDVEAALRAGFAALDVVVEPPTRS
jgi:biotin carboxylase